MGFIDFNHIFIYRQMIWNEMLIYLTEIKRNFKRINLSCLERVDHVNKWLVIIENDKLDSITVIIIDGIGIRNN